MDFFLQCSCFGNCSKSEKQPSSSSLVEQLCHKFSFAEIKSATANFMEGRLIADDALGILYKGYLSNENRVVTIKKWSEDSFYDPSAMKNEVLLPCQLRHPNLLSLIGFCEELNRFFSVYEDNPNGSLHDLLRSERQGKIDPLPWKKKLQICIGVAQGLHYLHVGARYAIIHRDMKSGHVFLDENWVPKIAGLSLSKRGPLSVSRKLIRIDSRVMGTYGYAEPEYVATGVLTEKVDVYAFGLMLLEVIGADVQPMEPYRILPETFDHEIVDSSLGLKIAPECLEVFIDVARRCLLKERTERPNMGEVKVGGA